MKTTNIYIYACYEGDNYDGTPRFGEAIRVLIDAYFEVRGFELAHEEICEMVGDAICDRLEIPAELRDHMVVDPADGVYLDRDAPEWTAELDWEIGCRVSETPVEAWAWAHDFLWVLESMGYVAPTERYDIYAVTARGQQLLADAGMQLPEDSIADRKVAVISRKPRPTSIDGIWPHRD